MAEYKQELLSYTNRNNRAGGLNEALLDAYLFIGVSKGNLINAGDVRMMSEGPTILAMANPIPEIMPDEAFSGGAAIIWTGHSDFPNQVNNVLTFPGIFRGALDAGISRITEEMKLAAARALARCVSKPTAERILPDALDRSVSPRVAEAISSKSDGS